MIMTKTDDAVLRQLRDASPHPGVHAGDLICKTTTRRLVEKGLAHNSGGSPSSLGYVTISTTGRELLSAVDEINAASRQ
jgi:hypothetical protein